eukprot:g711.t1
MRNNWPPAVHLNRVLTMAQVLYGAGTATNSSSKIAIAAQHALGWWLAANLSNPDNWYPQYIATPLALGRTCLLLQSSGSGSGGGTPAGLLPSPLAAACHVGMRSADWNVNPPGMTNLTGANLIWIATCRVYDGLATRNASHVAEATDRMWAELLTTSGQTAGCKMDGSFFQHDQGDGPGGKLIPAPLGQLYSGGYGQAFLGYMLSWLSLTDGLGAFAMPVAPYRSLLASALLDGAAWMIVGGEAGVHWDVSATGREVSRPGHHITWPPGMFASLPRSMPRRAELLALGARLNGSHASAAIAPPAGSRHFWKADYFVHRMAPRRTVGQAKATDPSSAATLTLRMTSTRTLNTECIAHENTQGKHLGHGALFLHAAARGDEYAGTYPLWDWQRVPGTTVELDGNTRCVERGVYPPTNDSCWENCYDTQQQGTTRFVGGLARGARGAAAMDFDSPFNYSALRFRKSWFFLDGAVAVLLAGQAQQQQQKVQLTSKLRHKPLPPPLPLQTALAQRRWAGPITASSAWFNSTRNGTLGPGRHRAPLRVGETAWFHHDGAGCVVQLGGGDSTAHRKRAAPASAVVELTDEDLAGSWASIGADNETARARMFTGALLQGGNEGEKAPVALVLLPTTPLDAFKPHEWLRPGTALEVVANNAAAQAVLARGAALAPSGDSADGSAVLGTAFFAPGTVHAGNRHGRRAAERQALDGVALRAEQPCLAVLECNATSGALVLSVSDPTQALRSLALHVEGLGTWAGDPSACRARTEAACQEASTAGNSSSAVTVALPDGEMSGSTVSCELCERKCSV